jgi:GntR family transcriptional regulator/MocR family aminotransferase
MDVPALRRRRTQPLVVHVTPSHQFPLGVELAADRRASLIEWAETHGGLIIENDYDGEFRFGLDAAPAVAASDTTGHVCLVGTFSRLIAPSLRVGYIVATPPLAERIAALKLELDEHPSLPSQLAVANLLRSGELDRHLRRVRQLAGDKRAAIVAALGDLDGVTLHGLGGGLHVRVETGRRDAGAIAARLRDRGVIVDRLRDYFWRDPEADALLVDYARPGLAALEGALATIAGELS